MSVRDCKRKFDELTDAPSVAMDALALPPVLAPVAAIEDDISSIYGDLPAIAADEPMVAIEDVHSSGSDVGGEVGEGSVWPTSILGQLVRVVHRKHDEVGLEVSCQTHPNCQRYRSTKLLVDALGEQAPALYLRCWLAGSTRLTAEEHSKWYPTLEDILLYEASAAP